MAIYYTLNKAKLYIGATKVKNAYLGTAKIYSSGNIVTYMMDGKVYHTQEYEEGQSVLSPSKSPSKSGYTFLGWSTSASGNVLTSLTMGDQPITLYAQFVQAAAWNFSYSNSIQTYTVPVTGLYLLTCYGAAGGSSGYTGVGGQGGTTKKYAVLNKGTILYVVCGGMGASGTSANTGGGYNGGGSHGVVASSSSSKNIGGGGGATHIATSSGLLSSVVNSALAVAGGGGGAGYKQTPGAGGGTTGRSNGDGTAAGGTQSSGAGKGYGGSYTKEAGGGGGGGYYGGYGGSDRSGAGGSGYIGSSTTTFKGKTYTNTTSQGGNTGNGSASIQFIAA